MKKDNRNFIIFHGHLRLKRLWQMFFTGWGLVMVAALVAGSLFTKQLLWTPISAINMQDIVTNQFKMSDASFSGTDKDGQPFKLKTKKAYQEYNKQDIIYMQEITGTVVRTLDDEKITDNITADNGLYNRKKKTITLSGKVRVDSSNGDKILTEQLVIKL